MRKIACVMAAGAMLATAVPALAAPAAAPHWVEVGVGPGGGTVEVDRGSLNWRSLQHAWWRIAYPQPKPDGTVAERHLELIDCAHGASAVLETVSLGADGRVLNDQRDPENVAMQRMGPPTPNTTGELVAMAACRLRPPPPPPPRKKRR